MAAPKGWPFVLKACHHKKIKLVISTGVAQRRSGETPEFFFVAPYFFLVCFTTITGPVAGRLGTKGTSPAC